MRAGTFFGLLVAFACASGGGREAATPGQLGPAELREAASSTDETLYTTLTRLRPQWLIASGGRPPATVFVDGIETGELATLHVLATRSVESVRYLDAEAASSRFSQTLVGGALEVRLLR